MMQFESTSNACCMGRRGMLHGSDAGVASAPESCVMRGGERVGARWKIMGDMYVHSLADSRRAVPSSCDVLYSYVTHCLQFVSCVLCMRVITRRIF